MTLITYIFILLIGAAMLDLAMARNVRAQEIIYRITLFSVWFLLVIRYYYGPDIASYVPFYERLQPWHWYFKHPNYFEYEYGFVLFCAIIKGLGLSYYWMTVTVTTLYFTAIALLFQRIKRHKTLALTILFIFDYGLIVVMHRQCLCIAFFIFMVLLMDKKQYFWALLCALISSQMHKSGVFFVSLTWLFFILHNHRLEKGFFFTFFVIICLMLVLPIASISTAFIHALPLPESFAKSLELHLATGTQIQVIWVHYATAIFFMEYCLQHRKQMGRATEGVVMFGVILLALGYHYFYLLERLRSFFLPILLTYLFQLVQDAEDDNQMNFTYAIWIKNAYIIVLLVFLSIRAVHFERSVQNYCSKLHSPQGKTIYSPCTIFDLRQHTAKYLRHERLYIAQQYWDYDFLQNDNYQKFKIKNQ